MPQRGDVPTRAKITDFDVGVTGGGSDVHVLLGAFGYLNLVDRLRVILEGVDTTARSQVPELDFGVDGAARQDVVARLSAVLRCYACAL